MLYYSVTVTCQQCSSVLVTADKRLRLDAVVRQTQYKPSELTYHWELFVVAGANSYIPRCTYSCCSFLFISHLITHANALVCIVSYKLVSARQSASVPVQLLYPGCPGCNTSASAVCCTSSADHSVTSSQHLRSSGIRCRWSDDIQQRSNR